MALSAVQIIDFMNYSLKRLLTTDEHEFLEMIKFPISKSIKDLTIDDLMTVSLRIRKSIEGRTWIDSGLISLGLNELMKRFKKNI